MHYCFVFGYHRFGPTSRSISFPRRPLAAINRPLRASFPAKSKREIMPDAPTASGNRLQFINRFAKESETSVCQVKADDLAKSNGHQLDFIHLTAARLDKTTCQCCDRASQSATHVS